MQKYSRLLSIMVMILASAVTFPVVAQSDMHSHMVSSELRYIQDKANEFLNHYNQVHHTDWQALALNPKMMVSQCDGSISAAWGSKFMSGYKSTIDVERYSIIVTCKKDSRNVAWSVDVPTTRPDHIIVNQ
ncbi:hypothetical protein [Commensalibacter nepenthis]|uniref:DUF4440 domain-containing protein n=1 Tax=Commensalibacter nepenthis TaxID=3043872 RepID=A0ABT6Q8Z8_9PROT|nr:hypothetical protein [Commensalibacter sp. TBRC 10068]MDI2113279.1 hypothetical protein [Commensalibacter sp. TBRC 10068]